MPDRVFTTAAVQEELIRSPAVSGCNCTYCANYRVYGYAVKGHGSQISHRLRGGDEHHNPENRARLALREIVSPEQFSEYVSLPGGNRICFQGQSGLWYTAGRVGTVAGHFAMCYEDKELTHHLYALCLPPSDTSVPLGDIAIMHYLFITTDEVGAWRDCALQVMDKQYYKKLPPELKEQYLAKYPRGIVD